MFWSKNKKNTKHFLLKIFIFTILKITILHGHVFVMLSADVLGGFHKVFLFSLYLLSDGQSFMCEINFNGTLKPDVRNRRRSKERAYLRVKTSFLRGIHNVSFCSKRHF